MMSRSEWMKILGEIGDGTYKFKSENMEQQNELIYMSSVIDAAIEGKDLQIRPKGSKDNNAWDTFTSNHWDFAYWEIRVKPEPPKPKTEPFSYEEEN